VLDERHFWNALRYVERNPVRAGMVVTPAEYRWSSAAAHCEGGCDPLLDQSSSFMRMIPGWQTWISSDSDQGIDQLIRECTFRGRPCGDSTFVKQIEDVTCRNLTPGRRGPKPK
jgi:putative transposase